jgi:hypothetical protein
METGVDYIGNGGDGIGFDDHDIDTKCISGKGAN